MPIVKKEYANGEERELTILSIRQTGSVLHCSTVESGDVIASETDDVDFYNAVLSCGAPIEIAADQSGRNAILRQIANLELQQTARRIREAALTPEGAAWLQNLESEIAALRAQMDGQ